MLRIADILPKDVLRARSSWILLGGLVIAGAGASWAAPRPTAQVPEAYERWRSDADFLFTESERAVWGGLAGDRQREVFIADFWSERGATEQMRFADRQRLAMQARLRSAAQTEVLLIAGAPAQVEDLPSCDRVLRRLQIWRWSDPLVHVVFVQSTSFDPRSFRIWSAAGDAADLLVFGNSDDPVAAIVGAARERGCIGARSASELEGQLRTGASRAELVRRSGWRQIDEDGGAAAVVSPAERLSLADFGVARLDLSLEGRSFRRTVVRGLVTVPAEDLASLDGRSLFDRVTVQGDLWRDGRLHETFEVVHHIAGAPPSNGEVAVDFWRRLVPGGYRLELRVTDGRGRALLRAGRNLAVTAAEEEAAEPPGRRGGLAQLTRDELVVLTTLPRIRLQTRFADRVGRRRVASALISGGPIAAVEFLLGGERIEVLQQEPFELTLDLPVALPPGGVPLEVRALDPAGAVLDFDRVRLRPRDLPFRVRFLEPDPADSGGRRVPFELSLPADAELEQVGCRINRKTVPGGLVEVAEGADDLRAASVSEGFCEVPDIMPVGLVFARVVASLRDGEQTEDLFFLSGQAPDEVEVLKEEVLVSVVDAAGGPVTDLDVASMRLRVGGEPRAIERLEPVRSLPLSVALMIDTSSSMGRRTRAASAAAARWFEELIETGDRAALITFGEDLDLRVPWTDAADELRRGSYGIRAHGTTRLYDSVVYGIAAFENQARRRALIVLTDGADTDSDHRLAQVQRAALRSGTAVFPVALSDFDQQALGELAELARRTGGALHHAVGEGAIGAALERIARQLRTEYRLTFASADRREALRLEEVEVLVDDPELRVRSVRAAGVLDER